jgi:hypothetical protein
MNASSTFVLPVVLPLLAISCASTLTLAFDAQPRFLCAPAVPTTPPTTLTTTLSWDTNGQATLSPPQQGMGVVTGKGQRVVPVDKTTDFVMTATLKDKSASGTQRVTVLASDEQRVQLDPVSCANDTAVFDTELPAASWPDPIKAARVTLSSPQPGELQLQHAGKTATVKAGDTAAPEIGQTSLAGPWHVTLKVPTCDSAPDTVIVVVKVSCGG